MAGASVPGGRAVHRAWFPAATPPGGPRPGHRVSDGHVDQYRSTRYDRTGNAYAPLVPAGPVAAGTAGR